MFECAAPKLQLVAISAVGSAQFPRVANSAAALHASINPFARAAQRVEELLVRNLNFNPRSSSASQATAAPFSNGNYGTNKVEFRPSSSLGPFDVTASPNCRAATQLASARDRLQQRPMALASSVICAPVACNVAAPKQSILSGGAVDSRTSLSMLAGAQIPICRLLPFAASVGTPAGRGGARRSLTVTNAKKGEVKATGSKGSRAGKRKAAAADEERVKVLAQRLADLRKKMEEADGGRGVDALIVPSEDPHQVRGGG